MFASPVKKKSLRLVGQSLKNLTSEEYLEMKKAPYNKPLDYSDSPQKPQQTQSDPIDLGRFNEGNIGNPNVPRGKQRIPNLMGGRIASSQKIRNQFTRSTRNFNVDTDPDDAP